MAYLINATQVEKFRKNQKHVILFDASWHLDPERNAQAEFNERHIIGARFFNLNDFNDPNSSLPNTVLRDEKLIREKLGALGITKEHKIIFYDNDEHRTSCRAVWLMKFFGHNPQLLYVLDGGLQAWEKFGGKFEAGEVKNITPKTYEATINTACLRTLDDMKNNLQSKLEQVIDMRHAVRYAGGKEIRPHMRSGHIPGSLSFPFMTMFEADGRFKPVEKIQRQLTGLGINVNEPIVTSCGSGISASILNFILDVMNSNKNALYDGSWSEWGNDQLYPGEKSLEERPVETSLDD